MFIKRFAAVVSLGLFLGAGSARYGQAVNADDLHVLLPGSESERQLTGAETHRYRVAIKKGEFFQVQVQQRELDVALKLVTARGTPVAVMDRPGEKSGIEVLTFTAPTTGNYVLEISGVAANAPKGTYSIRREPPRPATSLDKQRIGLEKLFMQGVAASFIDGEQDTAQKKFETVLPGLKTLDAHLLVQSAQRQIQKIKDTKESRGDKLMNGTYSLYQRGAKEGLQTVVKRATEARQLYSEAGDIEKEAQALNSLGLAYSGLGDNQKAVEMFDAGLKILPASDDEGTGILLDGLATAYVGLGEKRKALDYFTRSLPHKKAARIRNSEAKTLHSMGLAHFELGENQEAIARYAEALGILDEISDKTGRDLVLSGLGEVYSKLRMTQRAIEYYDQALDIHRKAGDRKSEAYTYTNMGVVFWKSGDYQKAIDYLNRAIPIMSDIGDERGKALIDNNFGAVYQSLDESTKAIDYYSKALARAQGLEDKPLQALINNNLGEIFNGLGQNQKSLELHLRALALSKESGNKSQEGVTLMNLGVLFATLADNTAALEYYGRALMLRKEVGDIKSEAITRNNMGMAYSALRNKQKALENYEIALQLDKDLEPLTLSNIGVVYYSFGEYRKALEYYERALPLSRSKANESTTLNNIGLAYFSLGERQKGIEYFKRALPLYKAANDRKGEAIDLANAMYAYEMVGNRRLAIYYGKHAINNLQSLRADIRGIDKNLQQSFLGSVENVYRKVSDLLIAEGRLVEAQQTINSFKDQEYFDSDPSARRQTTAITLTQRERDLDESYEEKIGKSAMLGLQIEEFKRGYSDRQPTADETAQLRSMQSDLDVVSREFFAALKKAETEFSQPADSRDRADGIRDGATMQAALRDLQAQTGQRTIAIYMLQSDENYRALIITPDILVAVSHPVKAADLTRDALSLNGKLSDFNKRTGGPNSSELEVKKAGKELYDVVFQPIAAKLNELGLNPDVLMWSLDGPMRYVPVSALYDGERYLAERYRSVVFTRANAERMLAPVSAKWSGSGFYNSRAFAVPAGNAADGKLKLIGFDGLKNAKTEVEAIFGTRAKHGLIEGSEWPNEQFSKQSFLKALKLNRPLVHIASHFKFEAGDSISSFMLLGDGTKLTLEDIKNEPADLFHGVELMTLSACETGVQRGRESDGREIDGFAELAQRKGAKAVLASLWKVDDKSTSQLMTQFYETRQAEKLTKAEALQKAQLGLIKSKEFSHPFYWSPFILIGNWR